MVVMKFIDGLNSHYRFELEVLPPKILDDVRNALNELHNASLVYGDLRRPNILIHKPTTASERCWSTSTRLVTMVKHNTLPRSTTLAV